MYKFNAEQKSSISGFLFNTASFVLTGTVLVEMYRGATKVVSSEFSGIVFGIVGVLVLVAAGLAVIGDKQEKRKVV